MCAVLVQFKTFLIPFVVMCIFWPVAGALPVGAQGPSPWDDPAVESCIERDSVTITGPSPNTSRVDE